MCGKYLKNTLILKNYDNNTYIVCQKEKKEM